MTTFRDVFDTLSPVWLKKYLGYAARLMYTPAVYLDGVMEGSDQGITARFPGVGTPTALNTIGRDRRIIRGPEETDEAYTERLRVWLDTWRIAGSTFAILEAIRGYVTPDLMVMRIVSNNGTWSTQNADGSREHHFASPNNWLWDADEPTDWFRYWVIIYPDGAWGDPGTWGDGSVWGADGVWGASGLTTVTIENIRKLIRQWGPIGPYCQNIIVSFDNAAFDPTAAPMSMNMPDGAWDIPTNRYNGAVYFDGT